MTFAEIDRYIKSRKRVEMAKAQQRASFDYILADLIGKSVARVMSSRNRFPEITTVYPSLFDTKDMKEERRKKINELSAARFRKFAESHNAKFKKQGGGKES